MGDLAGELARRGRRVIVYTSDRGYDDASVKYPRREVTPVGVEIRRLPFTSFGKSSEAKRIAAALSFTLQTLIRTGVKRDIAAFVVSTSPPFIGVAAAIINILRRTPIAYWTMDLNPEQLIALGKLRQNSMLARAFRILNRFVQTRSSLIIALDSDMRDRIVANCGNTCELVVVPPWSAAQSDDPFNDFGNDFRQRYSLGDALIVMYSGNHSPSNPLDTLLETAVRLREHRLIRFLFVGGGTGKREVEETIQKYGLKNVLSLPYQPRRTLSLSLAAGDVHVVSLGENMAGVIHPSKIYSAMAVGRPILYFGPARSRIGELIEQREIGWRMAHHDVDSTVELLTRLADRPRTELAAVGRRAASSFQDEFTPDILLRRVADSVERVVPISP